MSDFNVQEEMDSMRRVLVALCAIILEIKVVLAKLDDKIAQTSNVDLSEFESSMAEAVKDSYGELLGDAYKAFEKDHPDHSFTINDITYGAILKAIALEGSVYTQKYIQILEEKISKNAMQEKKGQTVQ